MRIDVHNLLESPDTHPFMRNAVTCLLKLDRKRLAEHARPSRIRPILNCRRRNAAASPLPAWARGHNRTAARFVPGPGRINAENYSHPCLWDRLARFCSASFRAASPAFLKKSIIWVLDLPESTCACSSRMRLIKSTVLSRIFSTIGCYLPGRVDPQRFVTKRKINRIELLDPIKSYNMSKVPAKPGHPHLPQWPTRYGASHFGSGRLGCGGLRMQPGHLKLPL